MRGLSSCGPSYLVQAAGRAVTLGDCAGILPSDPPRPLVLKAGTVFYVRVTHEMSGELDFPVPHPSTEAVVRTVRQGYIVQYRAASPGTAYLVARRTLFCEGIDPRRGSCRILKVVVTSG